MGISVPQVESHTDNDEVVVRITLPGLDPDADVSVRIEDQTLVIDVSHDEPGRHERASHRVALPAGVSERDLDVRFDGDVLEVRVPRLAN
jgi:HSP20 family molecular chaperone IbpA